VVSGPAHLSEGFGEALTLLADDIAQRRLELHARRVRDDDWLLRAVRAGW
jgi:hypothetical protein